LGRLFETRSTQITATDTVSGVSQTYVITDNIAPDWASASYRGALSIPGLSRGATLLAGLLGQAPWDAYRQPLGQPEVKLQPCPPLLDQMNPPDTRMTSFTSLALDKILHGNGVAIIAARNPLGWPTAAIPVDAQYVGVRRVTKWIDSPFPIGALEYSIGEMRLGSQDVIHIKGPCDPNGVRGMGVLELHLNTLQLAQDLGRQARSISQHGVPTGVLESSNPDLTDDEAHELKASWLRNQQDRTVAVTNATTKFTPLAWNPEQMQLVEARRMSLSELELVLGLPPGWLGGMNSARQYSNIEQDAVNLLKFSLGDHLAQFEQTLSLALPRGTVARANLDFLLRTDTLTRYQAHAIALENGFLTVDEVRDIEHREPLANTGEGDGDPAHARMLAEILRFLQMAVDKVVTAEEARAILNEAGANLPPGPMPKPAAGTLVPTALAPFTPGAAPAPTPNGSGNGGPS
jgi:HK97 family phage portal protein